MNAYAKPLPKTDVDSQPFWDACKQRELRAQRCGDCQRFRWPPQGFCPECYSWEYEWSRLPQTGKVVTFVVVHYAAVAAFQPDLPYVVAHIAVDDADGRVQLISNIIGCPWEDVKVGMAVKAVFEDVSPEVTLAKFEPA